jgi:hypothetical protein
MPKRRSRSWWNNWLAKMAHRRKEECGRKRNCEEAEIDGKAWLLNEPHETY